VAERVLRCLPSARPVVVGLGGGVAVGKSAAARAIAAALDAALGTAPGAAAVVVSADGFLLPNAELERRGLDARKGFPESFDDPAIRAFLGGLRAGGPAPSAPLYSHTIYDVDPDRRQPTAGYPVVVFEGVNALRYTDLLDLAVFLDADERVMEQWYVTRFVALCTDAPPGTFYAGFAGFDADAREQIARDIWRAVNLPNLRECIVPTRDRADVVIEKRADHSIAAVRDTGVRP
jgi:type I pantothenate kinase